MKIVRHTARDMRQALRGVREQLGEDAVILSSRRTAEGIEVTAAVDFEASTLEADGFAAAAGAAPLLALEAPSARAPAPSKRPTVTAVATRAAAEEPQPAPSRAAASAPTRLSVFAGGRHDESEFISAAAREAVAEHNMPAPTPMHAPLIAVSARASVVTVAQTVQAPAAAPAPAPAITAAVPAPSAAAVREAPTLNAAARTEVPVFRGDDVIQQAHAATLVPFGSKDAAAAIAETSGAATEAMGTELKTLRRMLETQLAQLAWNDLTRRAPIHTEILRELTEIGVTQDLAEHLIRQLPHDTDLTFARRFAIAGLSQYLRVTGDRWLDDGGRIAFVGSTGVGKTTTLAKVAVRWVLRHGPRDLALVAADGVRIGAQDHLQSLAQLLGVPVYTPDKFENLPGLLGRLSERLVLIDTPGASLRDQQLGNRLAALTHPSVKVETALVLAANTQAGALEEVVSHFAPANPSCCVLTKLDEAASLGGALSILIRAKLPISYVSEGQRVPEDLRPARALELVSHAVRLAKASGAAADEDLLRRRFGKTAHAFT